jgi:hypothetical protein
MARWTLEGLSLAVHWSDNGLGRFYRLQLDVGELVFVVTTVLILVTAAPGQWVYLTNRQRAAV